MNRRTFIRLAAAATAGGFIMRPRVSGAAPAIELLETRVISHQPEWYHGWPTLARRRNGQLLLVYSGGRERHVCPFGRVELMVSSDDGATWGWPQTLMDTAIDDRDAGVLETAKGTLLVTTFTSLAYEPALDKAAKLKAGDPGSWPAKRLADWRAAHHRLTDSQRKGLLGAWVLRSTDGGLTWSTPYRCPVTSPHGPIQLSDGRLLYPGKEMGGQQRIGVCESTDDGQTWRWLAEIPAREGDNPLDYHELHGVETAGGRIVVHIRNHNKANFHETLQSDSTDGGKTWSAPRAIDVWGEPSFLMRLRDDRLLMTYGHRREPLGNQARISEDQGRTWSKPIIVSGDGTTWDLGYPSTVQLADDSLLTVWYELAKGSDRAQLRQARWRI